MHCDPDVVTICKPGRYEPLSRDATGDWAYDHMQHDISADTTDERLDELVAEYEEDAQGTGYILDSDLIDWMRDYRDDLPPVRRRRQGLITLRNDFHNTSVRVRADYGDFLTDNQARRVARTLCPGTSCCCGEDELNTRGPQDDNIMVGVLSPYKHYVVSTTSRSFHQ